MNEADAQIARIKDKTIVAKNIWVTYVGALFFLAVTVAGIKDIDFFLDGNSTQLPIIGTSVPVYSFLLSGSIFLVLLHSYFHLFLDQLWIELGSAENEDDTNPLRLRVYPWMLSQFALMKRAKLREEDDKMFAAGALNSCGIRGTAILAFSIGPIVLVNFWLRSHVAHDFYLALACGISLLIALIVSWASWTTLARRMHGLAEVKKSPCKVFLKGSFLFLLASLILFVSFARTEYDWWDGSYRAGGFNMLGILQYALRPVEVDLTGVNFVDPPRDWTSREIAKKTFYLDWCKRHGITCDYLTLQETIDGLKSGGPSQGDISLVSGEAGAESQSGFPVISSAQMSDFEEEWVEKRAIYLRVLKKKSLSEVDLSFAKMKGAFLPSVKMNRAKLNRADLRYAVMEDVELQEAELVKTKLNNAALQKADLWESKLIGTSLENANLREVRLRRSQILDVLLDNADLTGADLGLSLLSGSSSGKALVLNGTNLSSVVNDGGALRNLQINSLIKDRETNFDNSFGDGSVVGFKKLFRDEKRPCQWKEEVLSESADKTKDAFHGYWRGWFEKNSAFKADGISWQAIAPEGFEDVVAIKPPKGCKWNTGRGKDEDPPK